MKRSIPLFYLAEKVSRLSGRLLVWGVLLTGICLITSPAFSQDVLWGLTSNAGPKSAGTIFSLKSTGDDFTIHHAFTIDPRSPRGSLIKGRDGNFYGVTLAGGDNDDGTIYKIAPDGTGFTVLKSFNRSTDGAKPLGSLTEGRDGNLYGMTELGGDNDYGIIFKIAPDGTGFLVLKSFNIFDGIRPGSNLIQGRDGYFYGMAPEGGNNERGGGTIFKIAPDGTGFMVLKSFNGDGPIGSLTEDNEGNLYGLTHYGHGNGTIFKLNANGTGFTILKEFNQINDGANPVGSLIKGRDGYFYGMTTRGGDYGYGTIFKIVADGTSFTVLKSFDTFTNGAPIGSLIEGSDNNLYGMTQSTIFKIAPDGTGFSVLKTIDPFTEGAFPGRSLIEGSHGNLYGLASSGGYNDSGTIFKIGINGAGFTVLKRFNFSTEGSNPGGSLTEGSDGFFYGMTGRGGASDIVINGFYEGGTIFKVDASGANYTVLKSFKPSIDGGSPNGSLIEGRDGFFYGMTVLGGENGNGTIFKIAPDGTSFKVLKSFERSTEGANPYGDLAEGSDGYLYGMTNSGGNNNRGTIFKITSDGTEFMVLRSFNSSTDGASPYGSLIEGNDGNFYGMTSKGGATDYGTIFKIAPDGTGFSVLTSFIRSTSDYLDNDSYQNSLIQGRDGNLYGMTYLGGKHHGGTIFKIAPDGTGFTTLKEFNPNTEGTYLRGSLIEGSDGFLYGMTREGGVNNSGNIFKIASDGTGFTVLRNLISSTDGANPWGSLIIQKGPKPTLPALQVNFGDKNTKTPSGWLKDYGLPFGEKSISDSTLTFGWKKRSDDIPVDLSIGGSFPGNTGNGRWRPAPSNPLLATLMHMQGNDVKSFRGTPVESYWELAVENGDYQVTVSVGDGYRYTYSDPESHSLNVEGIPAITHFVPQGSNGSLTRFKQATMKVTVSDGLLTIDADGGTNTKINYAIIQPLSASAVVTSKQMAVEQSAAANTIQAFPNPFSDKLTLDVKDYQGRVTILLHDLVGNTLLQTQQVVEAGRLNLDVSALALKTDIYLIKIIDGNGSSKTIRVIKK